MAITTNTCNLVKIPMEGDLKFASMYSADASSTESLIAAVTGKSHYIIKIQVFTQSVTDATISFGTGDSGNNLVAVMIGPCPMPDAGGTMTIDFGPDHAVQVTAGSAFNVDVGVASCPVTVLVWYKTAS